MARELTPEELVKEPNASCHYDTHNKYPYI